jgi:hypothetical protein
MRSGKPMTQLLLLTFILIVIIEADIVVANLFKNGAADQPKEMVAEHSKGKKRLRSESTSIVDQVRGIKRQTTSGSSGPSLDKSSNAWQTAVIYIQCVLLTHRAGPNSKEALETWWDLIVPKDRWPFNIPGIKYFLFINNT